MADQAGVMHQLSARAVRTLFTSPIFIRFDEVMARSECVYDANNI